MKTLSVTEGRQNLGRWLKQALRGEDVGFVVDGRVVALRPVKIYSEDYAQQEYDMTADQLDRAADRVNKELDSDRKAGRLKPFTGKLKRG